MPKRRLPSVLALALVALGAPASVACAEQFSAPLYLTTHEEEPNWGLAINDRGQAVAARFGDDRGAKQVLVYAVGHSGHLGRPWRLAIPEVRDEQTPVVALDDSGHVAIAIEVEDHGPEGGEHSYGCCEHVAVASWQLGARPSALQVLTPRGDETAYSEGQVGPPEMVLGPKSITAVWTAGARLEDNGKPAQVDEAFGPIGGRLRALNLATATVGAGMITNLGLAPNGAPVASWVDGAGHLATVKGSLTGALSRPRRTQVIPDFGSAGGFANDDAGDTALLYWTKVTSFDTQVMLVSSRDGGPFGHRRLLERVETDSYDSVPGSSLRLGGHQSLLEMWEEPHEAGELDKGSLLRVGSISGRLGPQQHVGNQALGFVGRDGQAMIIYNDERHLRGGGLEATGVRSVFASIDQGVGAPQLITPRLKQCQIAEDLHATPFAVSPAGQAILVVACTSGEYLIRYTP